MVKAFIGLLRDITKAVVMFSLQVLTRLFYIERQYPSSVCLTAKLDVIPLRPFHKRNRLVLMKKAAIEKWCVVNTWQGDVVLERGAVIGIGSIALGPLKMGENARCSQNCLIAGQSHRYGDTSKNFINQGFKIAEVVIEENVWICSNCVILPGIRIGRNSVIGAGSIVTTDIPAFSVAVGNPAKIVKRYDSEAKQWVRV